MGVGEEIVGRPVNAVLAPPQAERFAAVADVDPNRLVLNVTGCNKLVLLDCDRVFLFPRSATGVEWFERELAAYQALATTRLDIVPRLLGCWEDPDIYPFPFAAVTRTCAARCQPSPRLSSGSWAGPSPAGMNSSRPRWPGRALLVTTTPLIIAGCGGLWTRLPAPPRLLRRRIFWAGPDVPRYGRTCWPAPPSCALSWSTALTSMILSVLGLL